MRRGLIVVSVALALLGAFFALAVPPTSAGVARPVTSGIDLTLQVAPTFNPGDLIEIHFWVTNNGSLVLPVWPAGWPHVHPPTLADFPIALAEPVQWGHTGAYRTSSLATGEDFLAPADLGLYAIHGAAQVDGVMVFAFASFQVVPEVVAAPDPDLTAAAGQAMIWAIAAFAVSIIVLILVIAILARLRSGGGR